MKNPDIVRAGRQGYIIAKRNQPGLKKYFHKKRMTMHLKIILFNADPTKQDIILSQRPLNLCQYLGSKGVGVFFKVCTDQDYSIY